MPNTRATPAGDSQVRTSTPGRVEKLGRKKPFDIDAVLGRIRDELVHLGVADAAMFELAADGFDSVFHQLVACIISIRTRDEVTVPTARRLFERAPTAQAIAALSHSQIDALIKTSSFHEAKAHQIREIARRTVAEYGGTLPCDFEVLTSFRGVGPKCAGLALGIACGQEHIGVDVHVWRVTNRWGYVSAATPEQAMRALEHKLPRRYWVEINRLLVPFGKHVCTGRLPKCSTCPVLEWCKQVGVTSRR
jgi:endonuclease-3